MNKDRKGVLFTDNLELAVNVVRDDQGLIVSGLVVGKCIDQEAFFVLKAKPCDFKEDPVLGPGLTKYVRGKRNSSDVEMTIRQHFTRAGIDFEDYRERIQTTIN